MVLEPTSLDERFVNVAGDTMTGNLRVDARLFLNLAPSVYFRAAIAEPTDSLVGSTTTTYSFLVVNPNGARLQSANMTVSFSNYANVLDFRGQNTTAVRGLDFSPNINNTGSATTLTTWDAIYLRPGYGYWQGSATSITTRNMIYIASPAPPAKVTLDNQRGIYITHLPATSKTINIGLDIANITTGSTRTLAIFRGTSQPNLQIDAGNPTNLGLTSTASSNVLLSFNENGTVNLRTVRWMESSTLSSGDKVLIAV